jgi:hypothetical protein
MGCAKCHDHMSDPIAQVDYYRMRAIFDPHDVRTDRWPGEIDTVKDGLVRAFDTATNRATYLFLRGDERHPDTNHVIEPGVPAALCRSTPLAKTGGKLCAEPVKLPFFAAQPDRREFVIRDTIAASEKALAEARSALEKLRTNSATTPEKLKEQELAVTVAEAKLASLLAVLRAEKLEDAGRKESEEWKQSATEACSSQRQLAVAEARLKVHQAQVGLAEAQKKAEQATVAPTATNVTTTSKADAGKPKKDAASKAARELDAARKKAGDAEKSLADAEKELQSPPAPTFKPRPVQSFPDTSTGRRLAFARWVTDVSNPLTARVAMNHIWLRHFGRGIVPTPADFGRNGRPPSHPQLLDWLAAELMAQGWSMKAIHRLIVTSSTYRMASTPDEINAKLDADNVYLWRMNSRRLEAEAVRDNVLHVSGNLDPTMGGPDIDHKLGLTSKRRSLYLRLAVEKEVEFLKIFDGPSVTECYERRPSVMPQQALALANSELAFAQARIVAQQLSNEAGDDAEFVRHAFTRILARPPKGAELKLCREYLAGRSIEPTQKGHAHENFILVLFNHNDFVTVR